MVCQLPGQLSIEYTVEAFRQLNRKRPLTRRYGMENTRYYIGATKTIQINL
jgi:hypothetical protein